MIKKYFEHILPINLRCKPYTKCLGSFTFIAILSTIGFSFLIQLMELHSINSHLINVGGRQRMYSQRTTLFALSLLDAKSKGEFNNLRSTLEETVDRFERNHFALTQGSDELRIPAPTSQVIKDMYFKEPINTDKKVRKHIDHMRAILSLEFDKLDSNHLLMKDTFREATHELLHSLDAIVERLDFEGRQNIELLHLIEMLIWLAILCLLGVSLYFIIIPIINRMMSVDDEAKETVSSIIVFYNHEFNNKLSTSMIYLEDEKEKLGAEVYRKIVDPLNELTKTINSLEDVYHTRGFQYEVYGGGGTKIFKL